MGTGKGIAAVCALVLCAVTGAAAAQEKVTEAATGVAFALVAEDGLSLAGVGVRKMLVVNVYAAALYLSPTGLAKATSGPSTAELSKALCQGAFDRRLLLHFVRDVPVEKLREAFRDSLVHNMSAEDYQAEEEGIEQFLGACTDVRKGDRFVLEQKGEKVTVSMGGKELFSSRSARLSRGLWGSYFGKRPICKKLRDALLARVPELLKSLAAQGTP